MEDQMKCHMEDRVRYVYTINDHDFIVRINYTHCNGKFNGLNGILFKIRVGNQIETF